MAPSRITPAGRSGGFPEGPAALYKGADPARMRDLDWKRAPSNVIARFTPTATYEGQSAMGMTKEKYGARVMSELLVRGFRVLAIDQFTGQITPDALAQMLEFRNLPVVIRGRLPPRRPFPGGLAPSRN